ncbi:MAG: hypothetical protein Q7T55_02150 [Solirubrobacteraceae bacterium]|nr:hypothetical protein [Solirubrobacteraceae bacterium]
MFSKPVSVVLLLAVIAAFILTRVFLNFGGAGGFVFNVVTFIAAFVAASFVWQRSELHPTNRR